MGCCLVGLNETRCSKVVMSIQSMHRNARSRVWVYSFFSDDFLVQLRLHSALSFLLFIIVLEALPVDARSGYWEELLFDNHLALTVKSVEGLKGKLKAWKAALELKGWRVNIKKKKTIISCEKAKNGRKGGKVSCCSLQKICSRH